LDASKLRLAKISQELGVEYIDKLPFICLEVQSHCDVLDADGHLLFYDYGHWTLEGAKHFGEKMIESGRFKGVTG
jgi:hypothetical protein